MENPRFNRPGNCKECLRLGMGSLSQSKKSARVVIVVSTNRLNPTPEEAGDVKTTASEAVTNAVIHGYQDQGEVIHMEITADTQENVLEVCVKDTGVGIVDVEKVMELIFTAGPEGERSGVGLSFMEVFMDQVDVQPEPGEGTLVPMRKFISR